MVSFVQFLWFLAWIQVHTKYGFSAPPKMQKSLEDNFRTSFLYVLKGFRRYLPNVVFEDKEK